MLGKSTRVGRLFGIDLTVSWSFLMLVVALSLYFALQSSQFLLGLVMGALSLALVFGSVLLHELGHSLVAQKLGVKIAEIELHFFGGAAKMLNLPKSPRDEILIAGAGPLVSFVLAGVFWSLSLLGVEGFGAVGLLASINFMLGAFNLVPALPTDGGRILRAALVKKKGYVEATRIAVKVARIATVGIGIWAIASSNLFGVGVAVFLWMLGTRELQIAHFVQGRAYPNDQAPMVEVFDRNGRSLGLAPGGVEVLESSPLHSTHSTRRVLVQGRDGRIWIVTQRSSPLVY